MAIYNIFFVASLYFLSGVLLAELNLNFVPLVFLSLALLIITTGFFLVNKKKVLLYFGFLVVFLLFGFIYFKYTNFVFWKNININFDDKINFSGKVIDDPIYFLNYQQLKINLNPPYRGKVLVNLPLYPHYNYGDVIQFNGIIKLPQNNNYKNYLAKDGIVGITNYPQTILIKNNPNLFFKILFDIKHKILDVFKKNLPVKESSLLSGLVLGDRSEFSNDFKNDMANSGTSHIAALSGYNISLVSLFVLSFFSLIASQQFSFLATIFFIIIFVLLTGAEASVVRAGIMGIILLLIYRIGRPYSMRNIIVFTAVVMVIINPKVLIFDIGFILSFLSLIGIIYLRPALAQILNIKSNGFLNWKENMLATVSAQLMVIPVLINSFNNFSPTTFFANVIILETVPVAMGLGFLIAFMSFVSVYLSMIFSWLVWVVVKFEIIVIHFFAQLPIHLSLHLSYFLMIIYYLIIILFILIVNRKHQLNLVKNLNK
ncbi:MAG: ComEC/Rec2 family competence protein [Minisyncoccia bacterium]